MDIVIEYVLCYSGAYFLGFASAIVLIYAITTYEKEVK